MSERSEIKRDSARGIKNSGRGVVKGDARWRGFVVDYKEYGKSFSISREVWAKICTDAWKTDPESLPMLKLILGAGESKTRLAVVEFGTIEYLLDEIERLKGGSG